MIQLSLDLQTPDHPSLNFKRFFRLKFPCLRHIHLVKLQRTIICLFSWQWLRRWSFICCRPLSQKSNRIVSLLVDVEAVVVLIQSPSLIVGLSVVSITPPWLLAESFRLNRYPAGTLPALNSVVYLRLECLITPTQFPCCSTKSFVDSFICVYDIARWAKLCTPPLIDFSLLCDLYIIVMLHVQQTDRQ